MSKELIEELNEQVLTYDEWAREKCIEKLAADRIEELERELAGVKSLMQAQQSVAVWALKERDALRNRLNAALSTKEPE